MHAGVRLNEMHCPSIEMKFCLKEIVTGCLQCLRTRNWLCCYCGLL